MISSDITPNVTLFLSRDGIWVNDPLYLEPQNETTARHVSITAYGDASLPQPLLQHARGLTDVAGPPCLYIRTPFAASITVSGLHFSGCGRGVVIDGSTDLEEPTRNVLLSSNIFQDIRTPFLRYTPPNPAWAPAILLSGGYFSNLTVSNNVASRIDVFFESNANTSTMALDGNTVQQCSGNCYSFGLGVGLVMSNSVLLRDVSTRLFMYGTTDVIIGGLSGANSLLDNDFNGRGEYQGGPDGCAFDFETSATGFVVKGNSFSQSWGAGIMIFGHDTTSHDILLTENVFDRCGCIQNRGDRGGVSIMCPGGHKPSGVLSNNTFLTLPGCPGIASAFPGCDGDLKQDGNAIELYNPDPIANIQVEMPQLSFNPPAPDDNATSGLFNVIGVTRTVNATLRYTLDGSRPTLNSPVIPQAGLNLPWPGPVVNVNLRGFKPGLLPSITNGVLVELNYIFGREAPDAGDLGPGGHPVGQLIGNLDGIRVTDVGAAIVTGWAVDTSLPRSGHGPVTVLFSIDDVPVAATLANEIRTDLVRAGVAPNPNHGFTFTLPEASSKVLLGPGAHRLSAKAIGTPGSPFPMPLTEKWVFTCVGGKCT